MACVHREVIELSDDDEDNVDERATTPRAQHAVADPSGSTLHSAIDLANAALSATTLLSPAPVTSIKTEELLASVAPPALVKVELFDATQPQAEDLLDDALLPTPTSTSTLVSIKDEPLPQAQTSQPADVPVEHAAPLIVPAVAPTPSTNAVMIMGYNVDFPEGKRPFPAQLAVMNKVLLALKTSQHALLESPTGSGKTLALLCSSLTFQRYYTAELVLEQKQQRAAAKAAAVEQMQRLEALAQQQVAELYARANSTASIDSNNSNSNVKSESVSMKHDGVDDDDFAATQPSFEQFRYVAASAAAAALSTGLPPQQTTDGWISMASKKAAERRVRGDLDVDSEDDFDDVESPFDASSRFEAVRAFATGTSSKRPRDAAFVPAFASAFTPHSDLEDDANNDFEGMEEDDRTQPPERKKLRSLPQSFADAATSAAFKSESSASGRSGGSSEYDSLHATNASTNTNATAKDKTKRVKAPTIYFCSRTHSQLAQVVDELKNCPVSYLQPPDPTNPNTPTLKMCVLGGKTHYCVNKRVNRDVAQIEDKCQKLLDSNSGCSFATKRRKTNDLKRVMPPVWDIEDLTALGTQHRECAYFHARDAHEHAHIVFCPYNYVLDPGIRSAVMVDLSNAIVIFDEAHNVEDTCRSSASLELRTDELALAIRAFTAVIKRGSRPPVYASLLKVLNGLQRWLLGVNANASALLIPTGFEEESKVWTGVDALAMLSEFCGVTKDSLKLIQMDLQVVREHEKKLATSTDEASYAVDAYEFGTDQNEPSMLLGAMPLATISQIMRVVDYLLREDFKYLDDYKLVVRRTRVTATTRGKNKHNAIDGWELKLCLWCLNAAVAFNDVVQIARSVILTSGTLSPMDSFAGELGTDFPIRLEANHVVNMPKQVFAGAILRGPGGIDLSSVYKNQQAFQYQDALGQLLLQYASVIPGGVLMFVPSYFLLATLEKRWRQTGLWHQLAAIKTMFTEPRKAGKDFDALLDDYKHAVAMGRSHFNRSSSLNTTSASSNSVKTEASSQTSQGQTTGAIFIAVFRGKVSEGIDFSDDNARAVLAVGIPFPNVKDLQVALKREYQNVKSRVDATCVSGSVWYNLQAFRALNQALGRCIRHRNDYGAILLVDSRHRGLVHNASLSKWMRPYVREVERSEHVLSHFQAFFARNEQELGIGKSSIAAAVGPAAAVASSSVTLKYEEATDAAATGGASTTSTTSTLSSVKAYLANMRQGEQAPRVFSLFQAQQTTTKTTTSRMKDESGRSSTNSGASSSGRGRGRDAGANTWRGGRSGGRSGGRWPPKQPAAGRG